MKSTLATLAATAAIGSSMYVKRVLVSRTCEQAGFQPILDEARCIEALRQIKFVRPNNEDPEGQYSVKLRHNNDERPPGCLEYSRQHNSPSQIEFNNKFDSTRTLHWTDLYNICERPCIEENRDYDGNDIDDSVVSSVQECQAKCEETRGCVFFTFRPSDGRCWRKTSDGGRKTKGDRISGRAYCRASDLDLLGLCEPGVSIYCDNWTSEWLGLMTREQCQERCPNGFVHVTYGDKNCRCITSNNPRGCNRAQDNHTGQCAYVPVTPPTVEDPASLGLRNLGECTRPRGADCPESETGDWLGRGTTLAECQEKCPNGFTHASFGDWNCKCITNEDPQRCPVDVDEKFGLCTYVPNLAPECLKQGESEGTCCGLAGEISCAPGYVPIAPLMDACDPTICHETFCANHPDARAHRCAPEPEVSGLYRRFLVAYSCEDLGFQPILDEARCVEAVQQLGLRVANPDFEGSVQVHHETDERPPGCFEYTRNNEAPSLVEFNRKLDSTWTSSVWKDLYVICSEPTPEPTANPTESPTKSPTANPTELPTKAPTAEPTELPTKAPTESPTNFPTNRPTPTPSARPTAGPTIEPTPQPTAEPTAEPTMDDTARYVLVKEGDCESNGAEFITTEQECSRAGSAVGVKRLNSGPKGNRQKFCGTWDGLNFLHFNTQTFGRLNGLPVLTEAGKDFAGLRQKTYQICRLRSPTELGGGEPGDACWGRCTGDHDCNPGLKCFQRNGLTPVPGCMGQGIPDWDYCYNPVGSTPLSGPNDDNATNLQACIGECDSDSQCAEGLKCFQRSNGETIPGCLGTTGRGGRPDWDYCYDPNWAPGASASILRRLLLSDRVN